MAFADRIKEARLRKGYTQEQIAERIGVAKSTYTGYEKGNREPNVYTIGRLMEELGVDANFLWQDETTFPFELTYDEMENLVKKYRELDAHGKEMVDFVLSKEYDRIFVVRNYLVSNGRGLAAALRDILNVDMLDSLPFDEEVIDLIQTVLEDANFLSFTEEDAISFCCNFILPLAYGDIAIPDGWWTEIKNQCILLGKNMPHNMLSWLNSCSVSSFRPHLLNAAHARTDITPAAGVDTSDDDIMDDPDF